MNNMNFDLNYIRKCSSMIKEFPVYTEAEKKQVDEGRTCIKLSKGQPIYPRNFKKRRDTFAGADYTTANPRNKGYEPGLCSYDDCFDINSFVEDS